MFENQWKSCIWTWYNSNLRHTFPLPIEEAAVSYDEITGGAALARCPIPQQGHRSKF